MLQTDRLLLRQWRDDDRDQFAAMCADPVVMEHLGGPVSRDKSNAGIDRQIAVIDSGKPGFFAAERSSDGAFLGFIGMAEVKFDALFKGDWEVGWRLARTFWGQGYASEGARAVLNYAFRSLALERVVAFTLPKNQRSQSVMRRIGMSRVVGGDFSHPDVPLPLHVLFEAKAEKLNHDAPL